MTDPNPNSILDSVKKSIGLAADDASFDLDVVLFTNAAFGSLQMLGVGGDTGFMISDNTTLWSQYVSSLKYLGMIKQFIVLTVRLAFDPPDGRFGLQAYKDQIAELAWRINIVAEEINPPSDPFATTDTPEGNGVTTGYYLVKAMTLGWAASMTPDASLANTFYMALSGDTTINAPIGATDGEHISLIITSNGHSVTWGNGWNFGASGFPELSPSGDDIISGLWNQGETQWYAGYTPGF